MRGKDMTEAQLATCVYLIDKLSLRVGNEKSEDEADTVGCCSLRVEHLKVEPIGEDGKKCVTFDFLGKDSMRYFNTVEVLQEAYDCIGKFLANKE
jgi:DNA topoisomerase-1